MCNVSDRYSDSWKAFDSVEYRWKRERMVEVQLRARGVRDERLLDAIRKMPRHYFVPPEKRTEAYEDHPIGIGAGQTISQPYMVAWMTQLLECTGTEHVLDVGTGSGYHAAILACITREVFTVETRAILLESAESRFQDLGLDNIEALQSDGSEGWLEHAPYDRIVIAAAAPEVPQMLRSQLHPDGGRMAIPVGTRDMQQLTIITRDGDSYHQSEHGGCVFVPLLGRYGWTTN
jgi:protein-L-isoaspartate(D-aspartate) O-methyltransferase